MIKIVLNFFLFLFPLLFSCKDNKGNKSKTPVIVYLPQKTSADSSLKIKMMGLVLNTILKIPITPGSCRPS